MNPKDEEDTKALLHHVLPKAKDANAEVPTVNVQLRGGATAKAAEIAPAVAAADPPSRGRCRHVPSQVPQSVDHLCQHTNTKDIACYT